MSTSFLAPLPGNGSYIISGPISSSYLFSFSWFYLYPCYPCSNYPSNSSLPQGAGILWATTLDTNNPHIRLWIPSRSHHSGSETLLLWVKKWKPIPPSIGSRAVVLVICQSEHDTRYPHVEVVPLLSYRESRTMVHVQCRQCEWQLGWA